MVIRTRRMGRDDRDRFSNPRMPSSICSREPGIPRISSCISAEAPSRETVTQVIPLSQIRASQSMGANPFWTFIKIFLPQSVPGIGAGGLLVFVLSVGYYITPALVGGRTGQLISNLIAFHMKSSLNWGLAAALGAILLVGVLVLYWFYNKIIGIERMKLG